jgi:RND family efflux transporter MFP subunit
VAAPIEQQVNGVEGLRHLCSRCTDDGRYTLQVIFDPGVDLTLAQVLVQNRVSLALPLLPDAVKQIGVTVKKKSPGVLLFVVLYSPDASRDTLALSNYASIQLKDELARAPGVGEVVLFGGQEYGLRIWLDPDRLAARNLTAGDVTKALRDQNAQVAAEPVGQPPAAPGQGLQYTLSTLGRLADLEQLENIVVKTGAGGQVVRLKDVARLELGAAASQHFAEFDGKSVVALGIAPSPQAKPRDVSAAVHERMDRLRQNFPPGIDSTLACDLGPVWEAGGQKGLGGLLVEPTLPGNLSAERTLRLVEHCGTVLREAEGVQHVLALSEDPFARFGDGPSLVTLLETKQADRERLPRDVRARLEQDVAEAAPRLRELSGPGGYPVDFAVRGPEADAVRDFGAKLAERLARTGKLTDLAAGPGAERRPQLTVVIDRTAAADRGVSVSDISNTLQTCLGPVHVANFGKFGRTWQIQVQVAAEPGRDRLEAVKQLKVRNARGEMVPLAGIAVLREEAGTGSLDRLDLEPMAEITANPAQGVSLAEARWLCETLAEEVRKGLQLSPAYGLVWMQELPEPKPMAVAERNATPDPPPPEVTVSKPVVRKLTDSEVYTGRTQAVATVDLHPRVSGYLVRAAFKEGTDVKKSDLLFEIDPRPYQAQLEQAQSQLQVQEASLKLARATFDRDRAAAKAAPGAVSQPQLDQDRAAVEEAEARLKAARAGIDACKLNLELTHVTAPIDGRIGRRLLDPGNLVKADDTLLATIVSVDPMYVYFEMDERTVLRLRLLAREGKGKAPGEGQTPVHLGLADETGFPRRGVVDFTDNQVNPETGTLRARAVFSNADRVLSPGLFARVRLPVGAPHEAVLVPEEAVATDQGQKFVYLVNDRSKVVSRPVKVGAAENDLRVIEAGLQPGERVIVRGVQRVRPGMTVRPREVPAPARTPPK